MLTNFDPGCSTTGRARRSSTRPARVVVGTGDPLNGIVVAGQNSPHGRAIYSTDKNNIQPRVGFVVGPVLATAARSCAAATASTTTSR